MNFGQAIRRLREGAKVQREGWNGKGMWIVLVPGSAITVTEGRPLAAIFPVGVEVSYHPHIDMKAADGTVFAWNPNVLDILAEDWQEVRS